MLEKTCWHCCTFFHTVTKRDRRSAIGLFHRVSAFRNFQPELPVTERPRWSRQKQNVDPDKQHRITSYIGITPLTDHHGWNVDAFSVLWCKFNDIWFLVHLTINIFTFDFGRLQAKLHFPQNRQENAIIWCILVIVPMLLNISCVIW